MADSWTGCKTMARAALGALLLAAAVGALPAAAAEATPAPYGLVFYDNAYPAGLDAADWQWRAIYLSAPAAKRLLPPATPPAGPVAATPQPRGESAYPLLPLDTWLYTSSRELHDRWLAAVAARPAGGAWPGGWGASCVNAQPPTALWRLYDKTLYEQETGAPFDPARGMPGYEPRAYQVSRYVAPGTLDFQQVPDNWWADPFHRQKVLLLASSISGNYYLADNWATYHNWGDLYELRYVDHTHTVEQSGAALGAQGVGFCVGMVAFEYLLTWTYEQHVISLERQAQAAFLHAQAQFIERDRTVYISSRESFLDLPVLLRREVPNYPDPEPASAADFYVPSSRNAAGGFSLETGESAPGGEAATRVATISREFTTLALPFQFTLEVSSDRPEAAAGDPASAGEAAGRLYLRLHVPPGAGNGAGGWLQVNGSERLPVAGTSPAAAGATAAYLAPFAFARARDAQASFSAGGAPGGRRRLAVSWAGVCTVRAAELGVDRFDRLEIGLEAQSRGAPAAGETPAEDVVARARAGLQPVFSRNIARILGAGDGRTAFAYGEVVLQADTSLLPPAASRCKFTWNWGDGSAVKVISAAPGEGGVFRPVIARHTYTAAGTYAVTLQVDPTLPRDEPHAALFNDPDQGFSHDVVRLRVEDPAPAGCQEAPEDGPERTPRRVSEEPLLTPGLYWGTLGFPLAGGAPDFFDTFRINLTEGQTLRVILRPRAHFYLNFGGRGLSERYPDWTRRAIRPEADGTVRLTHRARFSGDYLLMVVMPRQLGHQKGSYLLEIAASEPAATPTPGATAAASATPAASPSPGPGAEEAALAAYRVRVRTSPEEGHEGAGTNARVFLTLYGSTGRLSGEWPLTKEGDEFEAGATDDFTVYAAEPLGDICAIRLRHDNGGGERPGWHVLDVQAGRLRFGQAEPEESWRFTLDRWLATDEGDGKIDVRVEADRPGGE